MQIVVLVVELNAAFTVNINEAIESQPDAASNVLVYVPAALYDCPFQV